MWDWAGINWAEQLVQTLLIIGPIAVGWELSRRRRHRSDRWLINMFDSAIALAIGQMQTNQPGPIEDTIRTNLDKAQEALGVEVHRRVDPPSWRHRRDEKPPSELLTLILVNLDVRLQERPVHPYTLLLVKALAAYLRLALRSSDDREEDLGTCAAVYGARARGGDLEAFAMLVDGSRQRIRGPIVQRAVAA